MVLFLIISNKSLISGAGVATSWIDSICTFVYKIVIKILQIVGIMNTFSNASI